MKAVVFDRKLEVVDVSKPVFTGGESMVRLIQAGICNTDLEITRGYFGFKGVLGHEFVGRVESSRTPSLVGARVVGEINAACTRCEYCRSGWGRHCPRRSVLGILNRDGAFREVFSLPDQNLHPVPDSVSDDDAVFVEPVAAACEILDQVDIHKVEKIAVLGDGKLGLLITMVLAQARTTTQPPLTLIGKHPGKMRLVEDSGVRTLDPRSAQTASRSFELVVEATGSPSGLDLALQLLKPRGTVVLKSTFHGKQSFNPASLVVDEITLLGSRCGRFEPALDLLARKQIQPSRLICDALPLTKAPEAFQLAQSPGALKVLLHPG